MAAEKPHRRGPSPKFVRDSEGREVHGLRAAKTNRTDQAGQPIIRYYSFDETRKKVYHGDNRDKQLAVFRFKQWEAQRADERVRFRTDEHETAIRDTFDAIRFSLDVKQRKKAGLPPKSVPIDADVLEVQVWAWLRKIMLADPKLAAQKLGIPEVARLESLPKPTSTSLRSIGDLYYDDKADITKKERAKAKTWWAEFCRYVDVSMVEDLDHEQFRKYANRIKAEQQETSKVTNKPRSTSFIRNRFLMIRTILKYAHEARRIQPELYARLRMDWKQPLKAPRRKRGTALLIKPEEFHAMYDAATTTIDRCLLLTGLNAALYPADLSRLRWEPHLDLENRHLVFVREKSGTDDTEGVVRVAVLWPETNRQLKRLFVEQEESGMLEKNVVFLSRMRRAMHSDTIYDHFIRLRKEAKIRRRIATEHLRDSATTIAARFAPQAQYQALMGHVVGSEADDSYILKNPAFVKEACLAIRRYYRIADLPRPS